MKKRAVHFIIATALVLMAGLPVEATQASGINWQPYETGIEMAREQGKKVFLYFFADWCGYCRKMEKSTFTDASVIQYLNDNFIAISINSDKDKKLASSYRVRGLPALYFIEADTNKGGQYPGYVEAEKLVSLLKFFKTESYKTMSFSEFKEKQ